ncbi:unnamed protein product [Amoebophrya sp. A25]|nr:unnamed protein product [Amoebophrya sp. A25]|eukprot:GSA25T00003554001.1
MGKKNKSKGDDDSVGNVVSCGIIVAGIICVFSLIYVSRGLDGYSGLFKFPLDKIGDHSIIGYVADRPFSMIFTKKDILFEREIESWTSMMNTLCTNSNEWVIAANSLSGTLATLAGSAICKATAEDYENMGVSDIALAFGCTSVYTCKYVEDCRAHATARCQKYRTLVYGGVYTGMALVAIAMNMALVTALFIQCEPTPKKKLKKRKEARMKTMISGCTTCCLFIFVYLLFLGICSMSFSFDGSARFPEWEMNIMSYVFLVGWLLTAAVALLLLCRFVCLRDKKKEPEAEGEYYDEWEEGCGSRYSPSATTKQVTSGILRGWQ